MKVMKNRMSLKYKFVTFLMLVCAPTLLTPCAYAVCELHCPLPITAGIVGNLCYLLYVPMEGRKLNPRAILSRNVRNKFETFGRIALDW